MACLFPSLCFSYLFESILIFFCSFLHFVHTGILDWSRDPRLVILVFLSRDGVLIVSFHTSLAAMFTMMIMHGTGCLVN